MYNRGGYNDPRYGSGRGHAPPHSQYGQHGYPSSGAYPPHHGSSSTRGYPNRQAPYAHQQTNRAAPAGPASHASTAPSFSTSPALGAPAAPRDSAAASRGRGGPGARGGRGGHFANLSWTPGDGVRGGNLVKSGDATKIQREGSDSVPPPAGTTQDATRDTIMADAPPLPPAADDDENPFRPPAGLRAEDEGSKNPQPRMSFSIKGSAAKKDAARDPSPILKRKNPIADTAPPPKRAAVSTEAAKSVAPIAPKSANYVGNTRVGTAPKQPSPPPTRVKKVRKKRLKPRPELSEEFKNSDSVYHRKTGNESVVGSGTYGKVYKAVHVYTGGKVALKKIRMEGERDGFPVTAIREIKILQSLKHINVVALQETMVERNDCFMVFEYLSHDLTGLLNHPSFTLTPAHKKHLARQLFDSLDYLHRRSVLHRDIKAANILVSKTGELKLADFGLARFYQKRVKNVDYTNRVVTIWYRSPELLLGETQYGPAVDIWSAACVLVEIFTRHAIFPGDGGEINQLDKIYAILGTPSRKDWPAIVDLQWYELMAPGYKQAPTFKEKYQSRVSPQAFDLLAQMLRYDPATRPTAAEVLKHPYFTEEEPVEANIAELEGLEGEWHEFESKALRKEKERADKEARRAARESKGRGDESKAKLDESKDKAEESNGKSGYADAAVGEKRKGEEGFFSGVDKKYKVVGAVSHDA